MIADVQRDDARVRGLLSQAIGIELLRRCCEVLTPHGIEVMPLKGLWLQSCVYARPEERAITDVDVIVAEDRFEAAIELLERAGFEARQGNASERALWSSAFGLPLDLHRRLFMPGAFSLPTKTLFAHGQRGASLDGARVTLPDPIDALCHLIGHFVKSRCLPSSWRTQDFIEVFDRFALAPKEVAIRVELAGMARAARYALCAVAPRHAGIAAVLRMLPRDAVGEALARACAHHTFADRASSTMEGMWGERLRPAALASSLGFALERSAAAGVSALAQRVWSLRDDRRIDHIK